MAVRLDKESSSSAANTSQASRKQVMEMLRCGSSGTATAVHSPSSHHAHVLEQLPEVCVLPGSSQADVAEGAAASLQAEVPEGAAASLPGAAASSTGNLGTFGQSMFSVFAQEFESIPFPMEPQDDFGPPVSARRRFRCVSFMCSWPGRLQDLLVL